MKYILLLITLACLQACSGSRPAYLGDINNSLEPCPDRPNCVSSMAPTSGDHYISPLSYKNQNAAKAQLIEIINNTDRTKIVVDSDNYVYAEYTSKTMGFVDDVEFLADDENKHFHVRSASRLGYRDFDVNKERIESIRKQLTE